MKSVNLQRAAELDRLRDQGDWSGVVSTAIRFISMDLIAKRKHEENNNEKRTILENHFKHCLNVKWRK